jgi:hypothetical protein
MSLPKTKVIGKKSYGLRKSTPSKKVGKKAVRILRKKKTPARLVKDTPRPMYGVYAGAKRTKKKPTKKATPQSQTKTHRSGFDEPW